MFPLLCSLPGCGHIEHIKQEWESTADTLPQFICLLDAAGAITRSNRTVERWGLGRVSEVSGRHLHDLMHPGCTLADCTLKRFLAEASDSLMHGLTAHCQTEDPFLGRFLDIQVHSRRNIAGAWQQDSIAVVADITELKAGERSLQALTRELDQRVKARTAQLHTANHRQRQKALELEQAHEELRLLSTQTLSAQERERQRIASELHDGIGQTLSAIKFYVENAIAQHKNSPTPQGTAQFESVIPKLQAAIEEVRRISMDLRPSILDDLGILATLGWFCREYQSIYQGIRVKLQTHVQEADIPAVLKVVIFRIVQEALNNVAKHAQTDTVQISLRKTAGGVIKLKISDRGIGFDLAEIAATRGVSVGGTGLVSMRERAKYSGGRFALSSINDQGTRIQIAWPGTTGQHAT